MQIFFKEDLFKRLHNKRPRLKEEDYADIYRCFIEFLREDIENNSTPYYNLPHLGYLYLPIRKAIRKNKIDKPNGLKRYERLVKSFLERKGNKFYKNPLLCDTMLTNWTKKFTIKEIEDIQNEVAKNNKS